MNQDFECFRNFNMLEFTGYIDRVPQRPRVHARILNLFWKQLYNNFKFKYLKKALKNKIFSKYT